MCIKNDRENIVITELPYQVNKANKYFDKGWTLMGLSDSNLSECNYIFTDDLRKYTPFGIKHHNPQRNLYQTLGMKGDELPAIRSKSQQELIDKGIPRKGWNVPTLFIDVQMNFEDQIMIHRDSWKGRSVKTRSVVAVYGSCFVKPGTELRKGETVGLHMDGADAVFNLEGAKHKVVDVIAKPFHMGDKSATVYSVVVETTRYFKEGFKLTNAHGNKGIVRMFDDGYVIHDPVKGDVIPQVVVSFKSVTKRKNFGQIVEALASRVTGCTADSPIVVDDDINPADIEEVLWAVSTRVDPERDVLILPQVGGIPSNPAAPIRPDVYVPTGVTDISMCSKLAIDATLKLGPEEGRSRPKLKVVRPIPELMEKVKANWKEYGF